MQREVILRPIVSKDELQISTSAMEHIQFRTQMVLDRREQLRSITDHEESSSVSMDSSASCSVANVEDLTGKKILLVDD